MNQVISSKDARAQFAEILNQVMYAGREFIISRFDKPVAKISPIEKSTDDDDETKRRKKAIINILRMRTKFREIYGNLDLTKIVIKERDKEYKKWTK
ncbi:type II toxin-antitoxin system prevent-host-death family antitoxin [Candidatus Roizmanbacteria bacterium]|nr:type II toxin-antitoxin system prevent-host-death family antitoxin [Candidatus Roizmanbacteria bacterium]MBI4009323.1 type II toxin-antitoxin system prevent-host-death family antitoxin [Candidatus Roizmanbacteria bacterium]